MATEPIRDKKKIRQLAEYYLQRGQFRNYLLIMFGIYTALRVSDMLRLKWSDVYDFTTGRFKGHITLTEQKTGKAKTIAMNPKLAAALKLLLIQAADRPADDAFIFRSNRRNNTAISRVQAWRIIKKAAVATSAGRISCHSLRKTFGYHAWRGGAAPVVLMDIYNHSSFEVTKRYLGISQDDRDAVYLSAAY